MENQIIRVSDAAREMGRDKSTFFKMLKREGIPIRLMYDEEEGFRGQKVAVIRRTDFDAMLTKRSTPKW